MQSSIEVITEAESQLLVSLEEGRMALNLVGSTDKTLDQQILMFINWSSDEIATECGRTFGKEKVTETFFAASNVSPNNRIYLSRFPVVSIDSMNMNGVIQSSADYNLDFESGILRRLDGSFWGGPVTITYTGGYDLPGDSPPALRQATLLMAREAYYAMKRGDATVRMVSHKDARVIYFDPSAAMKGGGGSGGGRPARKAIENLLVNYTRYEI